MSEATTTKDAGPGRLPALFQFYRKTMKLAIINQFQYRAGNYLHLLGTIVEPVIYLVVWTTVAQSNGGSVDGLTVGNLAAYYIVWTLVRNMGSFFSPHGWEDRIRTGEFSGTLLRPIHPVHYDLAFFAGFKIVTIVYWLPVAAVLILIFRPDLSPNLLQVLAFVLACCGAYLVRALFMWLLGLLSFWTTRVSAVFALYFVLELLLSGRLVPMQLMPGWVQSVADYLPFASTFAFPIQALTGPISNAELLEGLARQLMWILIASGLLSLCWRRSIRHYTAVGN